MTANLLVLSVTAGIGHAAMTTLEKEAILAEASSQFRQANELLSADPAAAKDLYRKALVRYELLVREGVRNGKLFYNIGNTNYRLDDIGRALVNYRRAELFMPDDPDLRQNLDFVQSQRRDSVKEKQEEKVLKTLFFWHYDLPLTIRLCIFGLFYTTAFVAGGLKWFRPRSVSWWWIAGSALVALLFISSLLIERATLAANHAGVLVAGEVMARKGDGDSYQPSFEAPLHAGTEFRLLEKRDPWYHIELADGRRCWIKGRDAEMVIDDRF